MTNGVATKPASAKQLKWLRDLLNSKDYSGFPAEWVAVCDAMRNRMNKLVNDGYEAGAIQVELEMAGKPPITNDDFQKLLPKLQEAPKAVKDDGIVAAMLPEHKAAQNKAAIASTDGMFKKGDTFYKLRFAKTGKLWAHRLVFLLTPEQLKAKQEADIQNGVEDKTSYVKFKFAGSPMNLGIRENMKLTHEDAKAFGALYGMCCNCGRLLTNEVSIHLGIGPKCGKRQFGGEFKFMISEAKLAVAPK